jgi:integrase
MFWPAAPALGRMAERVYPKILKDGSKVWDAVVHIPLASGGRKQIQKRFKTQREAVKWVREQQGTIANGTAVVPSKMTLADLLAFWLEHHIKHQKSDQTYASYESTVRVHIVPKLGHIQIQKLTAAQLPAFCTKKLDEGCGKRTVQLAMMNISQSLDQAVKLDWVPRNVADLVSAPRWQAPDYETWTQEEASQFLKVAVKGSTYGPIWLLALSKGLRKGELLGLRWQDLELENGVLRVRQAVGTLRGKAQFKKPKTPKSCRDIDLGDGVIAALRDHKRKQIARRLQLGAQWQDYDLVFANANGGPICPDNLDRDFDRLVKLAGVKRIRIHDCRHTYATLALANGENPKTVSETMGHTDIAFTLRVYGHFQPEQRKALAERMESLLLSDSYYKDPDGEEGVG